MLGYTIYLLLTRNFFLYDIELGKSVTPNTPNLMYTVLNIESIYYLKIKNCTVTKNI